MTEATPSPRTRTAPVQGAPPAGARRGPRVVAVVLNWNGAREIPACLQSLAQLETRAEVLTVLADNGSTDGSVEAAQSAYPDLRVLRYGANLGYSAGNNRAMSHAFDELEADWVCLLNSDVQVSGGLFDLLLEGAARAEAEGGAPVGAVGPCLMYTDRPQVVWACGGRVGPGLNVTRLMEHGQARPPDAGAAPPRDVDYLPGACLMISREAFVATGALDEEFFCYLEDADWCLRLRQAGQRSVVVPGATALHGLSASTGGGYTAGRKYMTAVNSVRFLRKHGGPTGWLALVFFDLLLWPLALVRSLLLGRAAGALAKLRGVIDGLRGLRVDAAVAARYARRRS